MTISQLRTALANEPELLAKVEALAEAITAYQDWIQPYADGDYAPETGWDEDYEGEQDHAVCIAEAAGQLLGGTYTYTPDWSC